MEIIEACRSLHLSAEAYYVLQNKVLANFICFFCIWNSGRGQKFHFRYVEGNFSEMKRIWQASSKRYKTKGLFSKYVEMVSNIGFCLTSHPYPFGEALKIYSKNISLEEAVSFRMINNWMALCYKNE